MLYLVATPIGNLNDITLRALETLKNVDVIACEDTLHSLKLLNRFEIKKPLISYHKFNEKKCAEKIISLIENGKRVALISDAGMPLISDPGNILVNLCIEKNIKYTVIPGASASLSALVLSGFCSASFSFFGFLEKENKQRKLQAEKFKNICSTLIFYTPPHGVKADLAFLSEVLGSRKFCLVKEITKTFESCIFGVLGEELQGEIRGEYVIVVEGAKKNQNPLCGLSVEEHFKHYSNSGMTKMDAIKAVAKDRNAAKSKIYSELNDKD